MSLADHRIRRLTWLVRTPSASSAFTQRQALHNELESVLLPTLQRVFDQYASGDQVLRIPKLTLQVLTEFCSVAELARQIEEQLQTILAGLVLSPVVRDEVSLDASPDVRPALQRPTAAEHRRELLIGYLRSGRIGWQASPRETAAVVDWLQAEAECLATEPFTAASLITGALETRIAMSFRLWQLLAPPARNRLLRNVSLPHDEVIGGLVPLVEKQELGDYWRMRVAALLLALRGEDVPLIRERHVFEIVAACAGRLTAAGVADSALMRIADMLSPRVASPAAASKHPAAVSPRPWPAPSSEATEQHRQPIQPSANDDAPLAPAAPAAAASPPDGRSEALSRRTVNAGPGPGATDTVAGDVTWVARAVDPPAALDSLGLLACDAGLILLHPFLPQLFEATGIAGMSSLPLPAESLSRAAALLHWLATGRDTVLEFELSLCKVLLGLTPEDPLLVADGLLSQSDRDEGDAMLAAVIRHWSALRQTSVAGLRSSFLQRRGMLRDDQQGWRLHLETESFDLLLGQLPWSFYAVKLPWMKKPIFTDWPTP